jgi:hypothetical protein
VAPSFDVYLCLSVYVSFHPYTSQQEAEKAVMAQKQQLDTQVANQSSALLKQREVHTQSQNTIKFSKH